MPTPLDFSKPWNSFEFVAVDTETTGKYPIESELCEVAGVKYRDGKIIDRFESLIKPKFPMGDAVIKIHGITNDMVATAKSAAEVLPKFRQFIGDGIAVAHHAPFDMGFLACDFEKYGIQLPLSPSICSSLLSRNSIFESPNHKLQTLIQFLGLPQGTAHRAGDDAEACLQVALHSMKLVGPEASLNDVFIRQGGALYWKSYSMKDLKSNAAYTGLMQALETRSDVQIVYQGGSQKNIPRTIKPLGLVRNPQGDYLIACDEHSTPEQPKKFFLNKITASNL